MTYRMMAPLAKYSYSALQAAASGKTWPTWDVTKAFVTACGGDVEEWRARWEEIDAARRGGKETPETSETSEVAETSEVVEVVEVVEVAEPVVVPVPQRQSRTQATALVAAVGALAAAVAALVFRDVLGPPALHPSGPPSTVTTVLSSTQTTGSLGPSTTSATNSPSPAPTTVTRSSSGQTPTVTTTTPTPDGPKPLTEDPGRNDGIQEDRVVELVPQASYNWVDIEYWRHDASTPGELQMDGNGVHTALGAQLAVIPDTPLANRDRCAQVTSWRDRVEFRELHTGSQLCGRSHFGRYASLQVRVLPNSPSSNGRFIFYGITWN